MGLLAGIELLHNRIHIQEIRNNRIIEIRTNWFKKNNKKS
jgi:hypothetical protein